MASATIFLHRKAIAAPYWLGPMFATGFINAAFILGYVAIYNGEASALICADQEKIGRSPFEAVKVGFPTQGFDGQFYYVLARDPWWRHGNDIDYPAYRHARIVYPALGWLLTGGDPKLLWWALPAINWLALVGLTGLGAAVAHQYGRSPWLGLALPFILNATAPALRDLADPVATLTACSVVAAWLIRWRSWTLAPLCTVAVLSREQNLLIVSVVILETLIKRNFRAALFASVSIAIFGTWIIVLRSAYGDWPFLSANTERPFAGMWFRLQHMTGSLGAPDSKVHALAMFTLAAHLLCSLRLMVSKPVRLTALIALAGVLLSVRAGSAIYLNLESYTRVFWWMPFAIWLWGVQTGRIWPAYLTLFGLLWPCYGLAQAVYKIHLGTVTIM